MTTQQTGTKPPTLYQHLENLPDIFIGEILNGQLYAQSRPAMPHGYTYSALGGKLFNPFHDGLGGPGGWWIINEPEIHFVPKIEVSVPDLAGWRREHTPKLLTGHQIEIVPDWIIGSVKSFHHPLGAPTEKSRCLCMRTMVRRISG